MSDLVAGGAAAPHPAGKSSATPLLLKCAAVGLMLLSLLLVWAKAMSHGMSHDEHQFVAPAVLLAKEGLLPYRDFPMFHLPNLVLIYSIFARFSDYYILWATGFGAICGWLTVCALFVRSYLWMDAYRPSVRLLIATGMAILLLTSAIFVRTTGRAWNHDFPLLMTVLAFVLHLCAARSPKAWLFLLLSGLCVGLAAGSRATYLPLIAPFGLAIFFFQDVPLRRKFVLGAIFGGAILVALLPSFYFMWQSPEAFFFDNFKYPRLRLLDPTDAARKNFTVVEKWRFLCKKVARPDWPIFAGFLALAVPVLAMRWRKFPRLDPEVILLTLLFPFIIQGCVSPTRSHDQHFYSLVPFLLLAIAYGFSRIPPSSGWGKAAAGVLVVLVVSGGVLGVQRYKKLSPLTPISHWGPIQIHLAGVHLREQIGGAGKVLTYGPIEALEGGLRIYPELALGPFASRTAHLVKDASLRQRLKFIPLAEMEAFLANDPPDAIVLGVEPPEAEQPFQAFADKHDYRLIYLGSERAGGKRDGLYRKRE